MKFFENIPKKVLISLGVILGSLLIFVVLLFTLGDSRLDAEGSRQRLTNDIAATKKALAQTQADHKYIGDHQAQFETLLKGDRLVPHTRRIAILELQRVGVADGLSALSYSFKPIGIMSAAGAQSQPTSDAYRVSVENIALKVSAPIDGDVYRFVRDINAAFPGSIVVQSIKLTRAPEITSAMLAAISQGQDAQIVSGEVSVLWRTAEAQEKPQTGVGGAKK
jgi:hypothetical protein